jgi:tetratricopeptide (TPR) repeat protein
MLLLSVNCENARAQSEPTAAAERLYDEGRCPEAIVEYQKLFDSNTEIAQKDSFRFRIAFCEYTLGNFTQSEILFAQYLKNNPKDPEARLKFSESLYQNKKYEQALRNFEAVPLGEFKAEALLMKVRTFVDLKYFKRALAELKKSAEILARDPGSLAEYHYWSGVVLYNVDQDEKAEKEFLLSKSSQPKPEWLGPATETWLAVLEKNKKRFLGLLSLGYLNDTNVAQSGGYLNSGSGATSPTLGSGNFIIDNAIWADVILRYNLLQSRRATWIATLEANSPYYNYNPGYDFQSTSLDLSYYFSFQSGKSAGLSLKYLDTFYNTAYYQDYLSLTPFMTWNIAETFWMKFSLPLQEYLNNKNIFLQSLNVDVHWDFARPFYFLFGMGLTNASGPKAVVASSALQSGTLFSRYSSTGGSLGLGYAPQKATQFALSLARYSTNYAEEDDTTGAVLGGGSRADVYTVAQLSVTYALVPDFWTLLFSCTYSDNQSTGFQGLPTSGYSLSDSYFRAYTLLSSTFYF